MAEENLGKKFMDDVIADVVALPRQQMAKWPVMLVTSDDLRGIMTARLERLGLETIAEEVLAEREVPALDEELRFILGRPSFVVGSIAHMYRDDGAEIARKAEDEQAYVIHKMLGFYFADKATWRDAFSADITATIDRLRAAGKRPPADG